MQVIIVLTDVDAGNLKQPRLKTNSLTYSIFENHNKVKK
jgi:hypothetical protein